MEFRVIINARFEAKDIDHAFYQLTQHFLNLGFDVDGPEIFLPGSEFKILPEEDYQKNKAKTD